ncbi:leucine-rich repeat and calponin homology domain-containing protein 4 [Striga asiatica]|uniref:Leucine-rich repeat and calponin homology domain-containing protein 4 n=1 Tax=Striga asiatica TaxID=4170 RepID=A0A5A7QCB0_STRAF|nr:leucine-rich repeat and calponin homology domain-containing protein 4 [Striga asiatica]
MSFDMHTDSTSQAFQPLKAMSLFLCHFLRSLLKRQFQQLDSLSKFLSGKKSGSLRPQFNFIARSNRIARFPENAQAKDEENENGGSMTIILDSGTSLNSSSTKRGTLYSVDTCSSMSLVASTSSEYPGNSNKNKYSLRLSLAILPSLPLPLELLDSATPPPWGVLSMYSPPLHASVRVSLWFAHRTAAKLRNHWFRNYYGDKRN